MGCTSSSEATETQAPRPIPQPKVAEKNVTFKWESAENAASWANCIQTLRDEAIAAGDERNFRAHFEKLMLNRSLEWIRKEYPECAQAGSIEALKDGPFKSPKGSYPGQLRTVLTLDDDFTGIVYASSLIVAQPLEGEPDTWLIPGAWFNTPQLASAKEIAQFMHLDVAKVTDCVTHAVLHIFIGADLVTCHVRPADPTPIIHEIPFKLSNHQKRLNKILIRKMSKTPDLFRSFMFSTMVEHYADMYPGSTVWDGGVFPFTVQGTAYPYPTRLLVTRDFKKMSEGADANAAHYKIITPLTGPEDNAPILLRGKDATKDFSGTVNIGLQIAVGPEGAWPKAGVYVNTAAFQAAKKALLDYVTELNRQGKIERCNITISMGVDLLRFKFFGPNNSQQGSAGVTSDSVVKQDRTGESASQDSKFDSSLDAFGVRLEEQPKHNLFDSESHFRAMKQQILERAKQDPERYKLIAQQASLMSATRMLELSYPECQVTDEGEFPVEMNGEEIQLADTRLLLCKDPKQEPKSIVAAMHVVPRMMHERSNWLDTNEMKVAEEVLRAHLIKLYKEGKVSGVDCMAQVLMGTDATIYQFVEGARFVDYSDERMAQFKYGNE